MTITAEVPRKWVRFEKRAGTNGGAEGDDGGLAGFIKEKKPKERETFVDNKMAVESEDRRSNRLALRERPGEKNKRLL